MEKETTTHYLHMQEDGQYIKLNCDWENIDDEEWELRDEADNELEQIKINKNN